jgi:hypothetical protein
MWECVEMMKRMTQLREWTARVGGRAARSAALWLGILGSLVPEFCGRPCPAQSLPRAAPVVAAGAQPTGGKVPDESDDDLFTAIGNLIARAAGKPPVHLTPGLLILPTVEADGTVRADGLAISLLAQWDVIDTPERSMNLSFPHVRAVLAEGSYGARGRRLSKSDFEACASAVGCQLFVVPTLYSSADSYELKLDFHGDGTRFVDTITTHRGKSADLLRVPGVMATAVLEYLGCEISPAHRNTLQTGQVKTPDDLTALSSWLHEYTGSNPQRTALQTFLKRNRRCAPAWHINLRQSINTAEVAADFAKINPPLPGSQLPIDVVRLLGSRLQGGPASSNRLTGQMKSALADLAGAAAGHQTNADWYDSLLRCGTRSWSVDQTTRLLQTWRKQDASYTAGLIRGRFLIDWATSAAAPTTEGPGRIDSEALWQSAREELDGAIKSETLDWLGHAALIEIAATTGRQRDLVDLHFDTAVEINPIGLQIYRNMYRYLKGQREAHPDWLLEFADRCARTGPFSCRIRELFVEAVIDVAFDDKSGEWNQDRLANHDVWPALEAYYHAAQIGGLDEDGRLASYLLCVWGARCGRSAQLVAAFDEIGVPPGPIEITRMPHAIDRLDEMFSQNRTRDGLISRMHNYALQPNLSFYPNRNLIDSLWDRVYAEAGSGVEQLFAQVRLALFATDDELAEKILDRAAETTTRQREKIARYRNAVAACRKFRRDHVLEMTGQDIIDLWIADDPWPGPQEHGWFAENDVLKLKSRQYSRLLFPFGFDQAEITGTVNWTISPKARNSGNCLVLHVHQRSQADELQIMQFPGENEFWIARNGVVFQNRALGGLAQSFRIQSLPGMDRIEFSSSKPLVVVPRRAGAGTIGLTLNQQQGDAQAEIGTITIRSLAVE